MKIRILTKIYKYKKVLIWMSLNTFIGAIIALTGEGLAHDLPVRLLRAQVSIHFIVSLSSLLGYSLLKKMYPKKESLVIVLVTITLVSFSLLLSIVIFYLLEFVHPGIFRLEYSSPYRFFAVVILLTILISIISTSIEYKNLVNQEKFGFLSVMAKGKKYVIPYAEIIYFKSDKNYSYVFSERVEIRVRLNLSQILFQVSKNVFIRVHKQFVINLKYFSHMQYDTGGNYICYLTDEEETPIPIGRKYVTQVKKKLSLS